APRALVDRVEAGGLERVGIVAGGDVERAVRSDGERPAGVVDAAAGDRDAEEDFLRRWVELVSGEREARDVLLVHAGRGVHEIDPVVRLKTWVKGNSEEPVFIGGRDRDRSEECRRAAG